MLLKFSLTYSLAHSQVPAYLFSWTFCLVINTGGNAIMALVTGQYIMKPFYLDSDPPNLITKGIAVGILAIIVVINSWSGTLGMAWYGIITFASISFGWPANNMYYVGFFTI